MSPFAIFQSLAIGGLLVYSAFVAWRKLMPENSRRLLGRVSAQLDRPAHGRLMRRLARWLQPSEAKSGGCGSGDGCGSCNACAVPLPQDPHSYPLHFDPPRR